MFKNFTIKIRLFILVTFSIVMMVILGFIGLKGMSNSNAGLRTVYLDRTIPLDQLAEITDLSADSIIHLHLTGMYDPRLAESNQHDSPLSKHLDRIEQNNQKAAKLWEEYMATYLTPEEKVLAGDYVKLKDDFINVEHIALDMYKQNRFAEGNVYMIKTVSPKFSGLNDKVDELKSLQVNVAKEEFEKASASYNSMRNIEIGIMLLAISLGLIMDFIIIRDLVKELGAEPSEVADLIANIARGNLKNEMKVKFGDDRSILANIKVMQESINAFVTAQGEMAEKHADGWISAQIEANEFPGTYGKMAQEINDLVNSHIAVKMQVVKVITEYAKGNFSIDMDRLPGEKAKISEAIDNVKITLSAISSEIKVLAEAGVMGDFSRRSDADKFQYMFRDILTDINLLLETCDRGFNDVSRVTEALSKGDLTQTITRDYPGTFGEVKESVNSTIVNLTNMIQEIKQSTEIINTAAKEIASGNNNLSHRAEEQAASLEETASSMEELTSTVKENAHNAQNANRVASNARELAEKGGIVVGSAVKAMQEINESSNKIAAIIGVIDEIAFQTNLLALNASVEAARAGENGRGFSVVATEVRNLAQRSATAARESKALIHNSIQKVRVGTEFVNETGQSLNEIVNGVKEVGAIIADIAAASVQQSSGIEQVNVAVAQMDEITQQNAALAEEASAASVSMSEQTNNMSDLLAFFQLPYSGPSGTGAPLAGKPAVSASRNTGVAKMAGPKKVPVTASESDDTWDEF